MSERQEPREVAIEAAADAIDRERGDELSRHACEVVAEVAYDAILAAFVEHGWTLCREIVTPPPRHLDPHRQTNF